LRASFISAVCLGVLLTFCAGLLLTFDELVNLTSPDDLDDLDDLMGMLFCTDFELLDSKFSDVTRLPVV